MAVAVWIGGTGFGDINHPVPGVWGYITAVTFCPAQRVVPHCRPTPVVATVDAERNGLTVNSTRSNSIGEYAMALRPGRYSLVVKPGAMFRCPTRTVTVPMGQSVQVDISCALGAR